MAAAIRVKQLLASSAGQPPKPFSDYDRKWFFYVHPWAFPNGDGLPSEGMTLERIVSTLLQRWPRKQFAQDVTLLLDSFDILQRHAVNTSCNVSMNATPDLVLRLSTMSPNDWQRTLDVLVSNKKGPDLARRVAALPPVSRELFSAFKVSAGRVMASPQAFASLRSKVNAMWYALGPGRRSSP